MVGPNEGFEPCPMHLHLTGGCERMGIWASEAGLQHTSMRIREQRPSEKFAVQDTETDRLVDRSWTHTRA